MKEMNEYLCQIGTVDEDGSEDVSFEFRYQAPDDEFAVNMARWYEREVQAVDVWECLLYVKQTMLGKSDLITYRPIWKYTGHES